MAKKKFVFHKKFIYVPAVIVVSVAVLLAGPLYVENFPIDVYGIADQINPQVTIITPPDELTVQEIEENAMINIMIDEVIEEPCEFEAEGEVISDLDPCQEETNETINELTNMTNVVDPPQPNMTSTDPPIEQLCDIDPTNPLCIVIPPPAQVNLVTSITKIDSQGNMTFVSDEFGFTPLAFFVEDTTNIDYSTGFLETGLLIIGEPMVDYNGVGTFDILIANQTIFTSPIPLSVSGTSDIDGIILADFIGPTGALSTIFNFAFEDHFDKFANEQVTELVMVVDLQIQREAIPCIAIFPIPPECEPADHSLSNTVIFTMDIARDDIKLIITDEQGITQRVFPMDSRVVVTSTSHTPKAGFCKIGHQCQNGTTRCGPVIGRGAFQALVGVKSGSYPASCLVGNYASGGTRTGTTYAAKPLTGFTLLDQDQRLVTTGPGGSSGIVFDYNVLTRNENYSLIIASPSFMSDLSYGKAQETQSYTCSPTTGSVSYSVVKRTTCNICGQGPSCSSPCSTSHTWWLEPTFREGALSCDLP